MTIPQALYLDVKGQHGEVFRPDSTGRAAVESLVLAYGELQTAVTTCGQQVMHLEQHLRETRKENKILQDTADHWWSEYQQEEKKLTSSLGITTWLVGILGLMTLAFIVTMTLWQIQQAAWK